MLLGRRSSDYDVATSATPKEVAKLFRRVLLVGAKFGVAMVVVRGRKVEVATFRSDLSYSDGRRPDAVRFSSPREDAMRRDFTVNGMFYDPVAGEVIDYVGGRKDLARGVIRTIGDPAERFGEDYLRMIRAVRFAVRLGFRIDPATSEAARRLAPKIRAISGERILDELGKMLSLPSAATALEKLDELALAREVLPELFDKGQTWGRAVRRVSAVAGRRDMTLAMGALLCELGARTIARVLRRCGAANDLRDSLVWMSRRLGDWAGAAELPLCEFKRLMANSDFDRLRRLWRFEERVSTGRQVASRRIARRAAGIPDDKIAPPPLVTGADLLAMGANEGPKLGRVLKKLYDAQLNEEVTAKTQALAVARGLLERADM